MYIYACVTGSKTIQVDDCIGDNVRTAVATMKEGDVALLENLRFHACEEKNEPQFAQDIVESTSAEVRPGSYIYTYII